MSVADIAKLESELLSSVEKASDEAALETIRVSALGKSGSVSALLKTLGAMTPDERKSKGQPTNGLKDKVTKAIAARKAPRATPPLEARLNTKASTLRYPRARRR